MKSPQKDKKYLTVQTSGSRQLRMQQKEQRQGQEGT